MIQAQTNISNEELDELLYNLIDEPLGDEEHVVINNLLSEFNHDPTGDEGRYAIDHHSLPVLKNVISSDGDVVDPQRILPKDSLQKTDETSNNVRAKDNRSNLLSIRENVSNHSYVDFSSINDEEISESTDILGEKIDAVLNFGEARHKTDIVHIGPVLARAVESFVKKLYSILSRIEFFNIVKWLPHGRSFMIVDQELFMRKVHPRYFSNQKNYRSFTRQLNLWGFQRVPIGPDQGAYYHQLFLRGMPNLVKKMKVVKFKNGNRTKKNVPDFYALSKLRPLPDIIPDSSPLPYLNLNFFDSCALKGS